MTTIWRDHYCWIPGFQVNDEDNFEDDETLESFNANVKMAKLINYIHEQSGHHKGNHIALPWGCDFAFQNARQNFEEMEKLIKYVNAHNPYKVKLLMSTPNTFSDALKGQDIKWATYYHDMFPYSDDPNEVWAGFFSDRPGQKKMIKDGSANLHASNHLFSKKVIN